MRSSPLATELHGSPRWRAHTRRQAEPKPCSHSAACVFPHPARGTLGPKRENSRMQVDQGGARRGSAKKHAGLPVVGHSLALAQESCILRDFICLCHPNSPRRRRGVKGGLNQPLNLWTWERGRHHPPATCRYHVEYTHTHLLAQVVYILFLDSKDTEPQGGK